MDRHYLGQVMTRALVDNAFDPILLILLFSLSLIGNMAGAAADPPGVASSGTDEIPVVAFCELVKHPRL